MKKKKILISVTAGVLVLALGVGIWFGVREKNSDPVFVFEFSNIGMTEFWGDTQSSYGPVSSDNIQTVFLSDTQEVTEVLVQEGDTVSKGDLLMRFDTTLSDLELERKRLEVEKLKLQLEDEKRELSRINSLKPMVPPPELPESGGGEENPGVSLQGEYKIFGNRNHDGSSPEKALICWLRDDASVTGALMEKIIQQAEQLQTLTSAGTRASAPRGNSGDIFDLGQPESGDPSETDPVEPPETDPVEPPETDPVEPPETDPVEPPETDPVEPPETDPVEPPETDPTDPVEVNSCYVIFKVTSGNTSRGQRQVWQGLKLKRGSQGHSFRFFDAFAVPDFTLEADPSEPELPDYDMGSGMTAGQIAQMRAEQQKKIKQAEFDIRMAEANYKIMLTEVNDGNIHADFDGVVISLLSEDEARQNQQPMMKVSGGGGFYIEGSVSELAREDMVIGQQVDINDWNTGMMYTGQVVSVGEFPVSDDYFGGGGGGNPNVSYYPFQVFVDESADLQSGSYVSMTYASGSSENGVYLEKPFLRTENGKSYVYIMGENNRLEKRYVTTGKSLWGSYIEVTGGLTAEDLIAFPYGKNVKPGVKAQLGDMSDLYGY